MEVEMALAAAREAGSRSGLRAAAVAAIAAMGTRAFGSGGPNAIHPGSDVEFAVTALHGISLHSGPRTDTKALLKLPILTEVGVIRRRDGWACAQIRDCGAYERPARLERPCDELLTGWIADADLADQRRFKPVRKWRAGRIVYRNHGMAWTYDLRADGAYTYRTDGAEKSVRLYRYRDAFRFGTTFGDILFLDRRGALCDIMLPEDRRRCDR